MVAAGEARAGVGAQDDVGVQQGDERVEVPLAGGGEEGLDHLALLVGIGVAHGRVALDAAARPAGELPRGLGRAVHDRGDLVKRDREHVVQYEGQALGRGQRLQDDEQRQAHRVGQQGLVLGVDPGDRIDDRLGDVGPERLLAPGLARAQHVQAHARDHGGQPPAQVLDLVGVAAAEPQPGVLHRVVGLAQRAQHPVGHRAQAGAVLLKALGQPVLFVHRHVLGRLRVIQPLDPCDRGM